MSTPALIGLGFLVGAIGTLIGAGGGFLLVPVLALLYPADDPGTLTGISLLVVAVNALSGSVAYARMGRIDFRAGTWFAAAAIPGAVLGAWLSTLMSRRVFEALLGTLMVVAAVWLLARAHRAAVAGAAGAATSGAAAARVARATTAAGPPGVAPSLGAPGAPGVPGTTAATGRPGPAAAPVKARPGDGPIGDPAALAQDDSRRRNLGRGMALSFLVGVVSSLLGIGGGIIHVPLLVTLLDYPVHVATATSHFVLALTGWAGVAVHAWAGTYHHGLHRAALLAAGVIPGAQVGALLSRRVDDRWILRGLALALLLAGVRVLAEAAGA
ncbi:sulfite exporter TauE/SafE family protein [Thermaerobacter sp. PB12/4term]|uniref:sulfite exporter TauE/SafE family protein n=1 Tax=Thermaerobacter sp. PB12/4term TaxID=2293838 RepID=UPI000E32C5F8|nr:sulfite exporter TauE/SafE family protein [Thermaerobacter sp. PB12/4term]QIA27570.1 sulfite exporter TauE/SafE family protein [Thermaerobacter sp. PB12/4term]